MKKLSALILVLFFGCIYPVCARDITHEKHLKTRREAKTETTKSVAAAAKIDYNNAKQTTLKSNYYLHNDKRGTTPSKIRSNFYYKD